MKLKQKVNHESNQPVPKCWTTDCGYTVALCGIGDDAMYVITAPKSSTPFAYTPFKTEVKKILTTHKAGNHEY